MKRSNYKHVINIQQVTQSQDATTGELTNTWTNLYTNVPCSINPVSARDFIQSQAHQSAVSLRIEIRRNNAPNTTSKMRFVAQCGCHSGKVYNPAGVLEDPDTGQDWITFPCSQGLNNG